ncbi:MAG: DUF5591 domain-containing protein [Euryarchaeota archaeon]|nr:DUF5591 domain-containing protein [Euryarchaeota archaeon]
MFTAVGRDGALRIGRWEIGGKTVPTPAVIHASTPGIRPPKDAHVVVSESKPEGDAIWLQETGSVYRHTGPSPGAAVTIPPELAFAPSIAAKMEKEVVEHSAGNAGPGLTLLPVSGGLSREVNVWTGARASLQDPRNFVPAVVAARRQAAGGLLYAPGCGLPNEMAILAYAGVDLFDSVMVAYASVRGQYLTPEGALQYSTLTELPCLCESCSSGGRGPAELKAHNYEAQRLELVKAREATRAGKLRELVEMRCRSTPELAATLRLFDLEAYGFFEEKAPTARKTRLFATSKESMTRPEVARFRNRLRDRYAPPNTASVLLFIPCSARKPYSTSRTHKAIRRVLERIPNASALHLSVVTSPLGVVPMELELYYPANSYDLPVTGHWDRDERDMVASSVRTMLDHKYGRVIAHLGATEESFVKDAGADVAYTTRDDDPLSPASLGSLEMALNDALKEVARVGPYQREAAQMRSRALFQFGEAGADVMEGAQVMGRYPMLKIMKGRTQVGMLVPERAGISLTMDGAKSLLDAKTYCVEIEDFRPKGSVFAVGIKDATDDIRVGDEVVVHHKGEVRASGKALMCGRDMREAGRGEAVEVRHHA